MADESPLEDLMSDLQGVIGCPPWCSWSFTTLTADHEHWVTDGVDIVTMLDDEASEGITVLEVRHRNPMEQGRSQGAEFRLPRQMLSDDS